MASLNIDLAGICLLYKLDLLLSCLYQRDEHSLSTYELYKQTSLLIQRWQH